MASLYEAVLRNASSASPAIYFENHAISYPQLLSNVRRMMNYFRRLGVQSGDMVTVSLPNIPAAVYALYALDGVGAVQNIIHPLAPVAEVIRTAKETDSKLVLALSTRLQEHRQTMEQSGCRFAFANPMYDRSWPMRLLCRLKYGSVKHSQALFDLDDFRKEEATGEPVTRDTSAPCICLHSGGTTDVPKIIKLSDDALNNLVSKVDGILPNGIAGKSVLTVLPAFHGFGLGMGIHTSLYWGASCSLMMKFRVDQTIRWINEGKVNFILGVPLLYQKLLRDKAFADAKLKNLECAFVGGDRVPQSLIGQFNGLMKEKGSSCLMLEGYGLTETVTVCTVNTVRDFKAESVGKPLRGLSVSIRDEQENLLPDGTVGEVYIAGDTLMNGYYCSPEATEQTVRHLDGRCWVRSGDLGYLDTDGFLFLKGRKKRVYKIAGVNVYPNEVEKLATELQRDVQDAALVLFETPKPHTVLFLIRGKDAERSEQELRELLYADMRERLLPYCLPQQIVFCEDFPKTQIGKIDYQAFQEPGERRPTP